ncbi:alcohol dehydrogenase catalytic domain-containing protein [Raoultella terrigena]|uniref:alcohol dehydrogenase catalytic domain-containing protein n=1 Tax=Raoultella terrigena TaxID=577 RepID=UPI003F5D50DB
MSSASARDLQPAEVMVRIEATGINPLDVKIISGYLQQVFPIDFPYVPGTDARCFPCSPRFRSAAWERSRK